MPSESSPASHGRIAVVAWLVALAIVITGELLPETSLPITFLAAAGVSDKVLHFTAYTALALIPAVGFRLKTGLACAFLMIVLGAALELAQKLVPGRTCDLLDALANSAGVLAGVALALLVRFGWSLGHSR
jgi:hypothetical protein